MALHFKAAWKWSVGIAIYYFNEQNTISLMFEGKLPKNVSRICLQRHNDVDRIHFNSVQTYEDSAMSLNHVYLDMLTCCWSKDLVAQWGFSTLTLSRLPLELESQRKRSGDWTSTNEMQASGVCGRDGKTPASKSRRRQSTIPCDVNHGVDAGPAFPLEAESAENFADCRVVWPDVDAGQCPCVFTRHFWQGGMLWVPLDKMNIFVRNQTILSWNLLAQG